MKKNWTRIMAVGMAMTILGGITVFANEQLLIAQAPAAETEDMTAQEALSAFLTQSGKVVSVDASETEGVSIVEIENEQGGLRFALDANSLILDRRDGAYLAAADLTEGMEIAVIYDANGPMGLSLPPYLGEVTAVVANADAGSIAVGHFDADLTDWQHSLLLNISDETSIQSRNGTKIRRSAEDIKNQDALVFYDITTRSIPAQTTPSLVLLLTEAEEGTAESTTAAELQAQIMLPLRRAAEENGYRVTWQGKDQPILLEKEGSRMEITIGSDTYVVDGDMTKKAAMPSELKNGVAYVSGDIFQG